MVVLENNELKTRSDLQNLLQNNPGLIIIKLGADWCGPCKRIEPVVNKFFASNLENVIFVKVDVDESMDLFALYKRFRVLKGVPGLLCYTQEETDVYPNIVCNTGDVTVVDKFFNDCLDLYQKL